MAKQFIKGVIRLGGVNVSRYNRALDRYKKLYRKYKEFTMVPEEAFVNNIELCDNFLRREGDIVECGVWRGGMIAAIAELAGNSRMIHLFDSFEGLPPAKDIDGKDALQWQSNTDSPNYFDNCSADESFAISALIRAGHQNYKIYKGWFRETLSSYQGREIAVLRLDGDWYDSIRDCLVKLYPLVVENGLIIIDDYYTWDGCSRAVHDYLSEIKSASRVHEWKNQVAYIVKKN